MMIPQPFRADLQVPRDIPCLPFVKRRFPKHAKFLFSYYHTRTRNWLIAGWCDKPRGRFVDIVCLGKSPDLTRALVTELHVMLTPEPGTELTARQVMKAEQSFQREEINQMYDEDRERLDFRKYVYNKRCRNSTNPMWNDARNHTLLKSYIRG